MELGKFHHADGTHDFAIAEPEEDGNGLKVVWFPEPGGTYNIDHNVAKGTGDGEFSA